MTRSTTKKEEIPHFVAILSIAEIGLGSFLHGLKLPLSGQILSLNQVFILSRASIKIQAKDAPGQISTTSALLKSLAPAGKKLTPMLAISVQGQLFAFGLFIFGNNFLGRILGAILSSLWAYIQPLCLYLILFGKDLVFMGEYFLRKLGKVIQVGPENLILILSSFIILKVLLAMISVVLAHKLGTNTLTKIDSWTLKQSKNALPKSSKRKGSNAKLAFYDTFNPLFIFSLVLSITFFIFAKSSYVDIIWILLRPISLGYIIFYLLRAYPIEKTIDKMKDGKYKEVLKASLDTIKKIKGK
jgi:hypothetical protein